MSTRGRSSSSWMTPWSERTTVEVNATWSSETIELLGVSTKEEEDGESLPPHCWLLSDDSCSLFSPDEHSVPLLS